MNKEILDRIKSRLEIGAKKYGEELKPNDGRDWVKETIEEILDSCVYLGAKLLLIEEYEKHEDSRVPINAEEVELVHRALVDQGAGAYVNGENKQAEKFRAVAEKIKVAGKI